MAPTVNGSVFHIHYCLWFPLVFDCVTEMMDSMCSAASPRLNQTLKTHSGINQGRGGGDLLVSDCQIICQMSLCACVTFEVGAPPGRCWGEAAKSSYIRKCKYSLKTPGTMVKSRWSQLEKMRCSIKTHLELHENDIFCFPLLSTHPLYIIIVPLQYSTLENVFGYVILLLGDLKWC